MSFKRILAVGCSHGMHICPDARRAVLQFVKEYKPHTVVHLGDYCDTAAFRAGAAGSQDEFEDIEPDIDGGLTFLAEIGATHVLDGNHDARVYKWAKSPRAVYAYVGGKVVAAMEAHADKYKYKKSLYRGVFQQPFIFGNYKFLHGTMYNVSATRDHATTYGNVVHAHTHRPEVCYGVRDDNPKGFCVGTLTRRREVEYANTRKATLSWGAAFVWGEYNDNACHLNLHFGPSEQIPGQKWRLP